MTKKEFIYQYILCMVPYLENRLINSGVIEQAIATADAVHDKVPFDPEQDENV